MNKRTANKVILEELKQLDLNEKCEAHAFIYNQAINAYDILSKKELIELIHDHFDLIPTRWMQE